MPARDGAARRGDSTPAGAAAAGNARNRVRAVALDGRTGWWRRRTQAPPIRAPGCTRTGSRSRRRVRPVYNVNMRPEYNAMK